MKTLRCLLALALACPCVPAQDLPRDGPKLSPFRSMRAAGEGIEVQVDDENWFGLESVHGFDTATLLKESKRLCGDRWWKRITEDLPALLEAMGRKPDTAVDIEVRDLKTGARRKLAGVAMTGEKHKALRDANARAEREAEREVPKAALPPSELSAEDARADLDALKAMLDQQFAYRELRSVDLDQLLAEAKARLGEGAVARTALAREVDRILRAFGDGHSRLAPGQLPPSASYLPFLVAQGKDGVVAFKADRSGLLDDKYPVLEAIDGVPLPRWIEAASARATAGSPAMVARQALRGMRELADLRAALSLPDAAEVRVSLRGSGGTRDVTLRTAPRSPVYGEWPRTRTRMLEGNVGYLRLPEMTSEPAFLDGIDEAMQKFRGTKGLVIDVRGNGGGTRDGLRRLFPYFMGPKDGPQVVNAAAVFGEAGASADGQLADRGMYPADWSGYGEAQRAAIAAFQKTFKPSWQLPAGRFGPWHYLVLDRTDNGKAFHYDKKVVVLIDDGCFSATDIFVAALGTRPQVTLLGTATSGGSGRARRFTLKHSGIVLQLSSMASFRPDGQLFEGNGVPPDVVCEPKATDFVGTTDTALDQALARLK